MIMIIIIFVIINSITPAGRGNHGKAATYQIVSHEVLLMTMMIVVVVVVVMTVIVMMILVIIVMPRPATLQHQ